jgi:NAD(P)-dependent dehydrogenase (short-subunit alcohol dehydrogenase family)
MNNDNRKAWFITGASKGLGLEITRAALSAGDLVAATIRQKKDSIIKKLGSNPQLLELRMDVTDEEQVKTAVKKALKHYGRLDVVVNNEGYGILTAIEEASDTEAREQYNTNVFGVLNVLRAVLPHLRQQRSGHIINMSSMFAFDTIPGWGLYASTNLAIEGISAGLSKELGPFGIKVTIIEPGFFTTSLTSKKSCRVAANSIDDYNETMVGYIKKQTASFHGKEPGDPAKLANIVILLSRAERVPLHLPIGADAIAHYEVKIKQLANDVDAWRKVTMQTDHDKGRSNAINSKSIQSHD